MDRPRHSYHSACRDISLTIPSIPPEEKTPLLDHLDSNDYNGRIHPARTATKNRYAIQRALGFKNIVIYVLLFLNFVLLTKLGSMYYNGSQLQLQQFSAVTLEEPEHEGADATSVDFWLKMVLIVFLVMIGGIFAGKLPMARMDWDSPCILLPSPPLFLHFPLFYRQLASNRSVRYTRRFALICIHLNTKKSRPTDLYASCLLPVLNCSIGLTIGLMGLDETNLHVLMASGTPTEQLHAETVYSLLSRGKHWVLGIGLRPLWLPLVQCCTKYTLACVLMGSLYTCIQYSDTLAWKCHRQRDSARGTRL